MKKYVTLFIGIIVVALSIIFYVGYNKDTNIKLKKVRVADATLTSWTYMSSSKLFISKWNE